MSEVPEEAVEAAARAMAILDDHDGCFLEVDAWNAQEEWEREAHPESYPGSAIEDCAYWIEKTRAALEAAAPFIAAKALEDAAEQTLEAVIAQMKMSSLRFESAAEPESREFLLGYREGRFKVQHILGELRARKADRARSAAVRGEG